MGTSYQIEKEKAFNAFYNTYSELDNRYHHSLSVLKTALKLADKLNIDKDKVAVAAILHDIKKHYNELDLKELDEKDYDECLKHPPLSHAYLGAKYYMDNIGSDLEIYEAIKYHVNGKKNLSLLGKIILISDYIEDLRTYDNCINCRNLVNKGLFYTSIYEMTKFTIELYPYNEVANKYLNEVLIESKVDMMNEKLNLIKEACLKINASNITCYNTNLSSPFFDNIICATVTSNRQINAFKSYLQEYFNDTSFKIKNVEGLDSNWLLVDCYDTLINIFTIEERQRVDLDKLLSVNEHFEL